MIASRWKPWSGFAVTTKTPKNSGDAGHWATGMYRLCGLVNVGSEDQSGSTVDEQPGSHMLTGAIRSVILE